MRIAKLEAALISEARSPPSVTEVPELFDPEVSAM